MKHINCENIAIFFFAFATVQWAANPLDGKDEKVLELGVSDNNGVEMVDGIYESRLVKELRAKIERKDGDGTKRWGNSKER